MKETRWLRRGGCRCYSRKLFRSRKGVVRVGRRCRDEIMLERMNKGVYTDKKIRKIVLF